jgi:Flp pilus assembly protein TadD
LGALYKSLGRWEEAEAQFRTLLEVSPDISHARLNLADLQLRRGQWLEAEAECLHALEFEDTGGEAQKKLALIALQFRADPERALAYCEEGLTLNPDAATWTMRGVALRALEREAEAENS